VPRNLEGKSAKKDGQNYTYQRAERQALSFVFLRGDSLLGLIDFLSILLAKTIRFQTRCYGTTRASWVLLVLQQQQRAVGRLGVGLYLAMPPGGVGG